MCRSRLFVALLAVCFLAVLPATAHAQLGLGIERFERVDMDDIPEEYRKWVEEEVGYLITEEEFEVFQRLDSDLKYQRFMEEFWNQRDPTPGTPRNEYYELHYERLAYANKFYGRSSPLPGWRTDRGRAYILLGPPREVSRVPNDMLLYPNETWFYSADPELGLPPFFYLVFFQRYNTGDFRLYSPLSDGPEKLFNGAGLHEIDQMMERFTDDPLTPGGRPGPGYAPSGYGPNSEAIRLLLLETNPDLANAAFSYYPSEGGLEFGITPLASELLIGSIENVNEVIMPDATWAYNVLTGVTDSDVRFETLDVRTLAVPLLGVDGEPMIHFATKTQGEDLHVGEFEDEYYFTFKAVGSIVDSETRVLQNFDQTMHGDLDDQQARNFTSNPFIYMDLVPTLSGRQTISVMLENTVAHSFGRGEITLDVPRAHPDRVQIAGPVLALDAQRRQFDPFGERYPFQYRDIAMVPSVDGQYYLGQPIHAFAQILLPAAPPSAVMARYALIGPTGAAVREGAVEVPAANADDHGVVGNVFTIDPDGLVAGTYRLRVSVDENSAATKEAEVTILPVPEELERPFINAQPAAPAIDVETALARAAQHRIAGQLDEAVTWLDYAQDRAPEDREILERYAGLLEETGRYERLVEVLLPASAENPRDVDMLLRLARTYALSAQHYDAIRFYERARMVMDEERTDVLNALAAEYQADGDPDKARSLLEMSLELDPEQTDARAMLDRLDGTPGDSGEAQDQ